MATAGRLRWRGFQPDPFVGRLFAWGYNSSGECGFGDRTQRSSPVQVGSAGDWKLGMAAGYSSLILRSGRAWGTGGYLPLGGPGFSTRSSPVQIGGAVDWTTLAGSTDFYYPSYGGIRSGKLFMWGNNRYGQLGDGTRTDRSSPVQVGAETDWTVLTAGKEASLGIRGGMLFAWGFNGYGICGVASSTASFSSPVQIGALSDWTAISMGYYGVHALRAGKLYGWSFNGFGELGNGTVDLSDHATPVQIGTFDDWTYLSHGNSCCFGIRKPGRLYAWGYNEGVGALGLGNLTNRSSPVQVGAAIDWSFIDIGIGTSYATAFGIRSGRLYAWGYDGNNWGMLGLGTSGTSRSSPVQVGAETDWLFARSGPYQSMGIRHT